LSTAQSYGEFAGFGEERSVVVAMPVKSMPENPEDIVPTLRSIDAAADHLRSRRHGRAVLLVVWSNYAIANDRRQEPDEIARHEALSDAYFRTAAHELEKSNVAVKLVTDRVRPNTSISVIRNRMAAALLDIYCQEYKMSGELVARTPLIMVDADTTFDPLPDPFGEAVELHRRGKAVLATGNLRYDGELLATAPDNLRLLENSDLRLLYIAEHLRRAMFGHQKPNARRGYFPEQYMSIALGELYGLGGFNTYDKHNESYHLRKAAAIAIAETINGHPSSGGQVHPDLAWRADGITHYGGFEVSTDSVALVRLVELYGIDAILQFDEGPRYVMRTSDAPQAMPPHRRRSIETWDAAAQALTQIYEYFAANGGYFDTPSLGQDLRRISDMLHSAFGRGPGQLLWCPIVQSRSDASQNSVAPRQYGKPQNRGR